MSRYLPLSVSTRFSNGAQRCCAFRNLGRSDHSIAGLQFVQRSKHANDLSVTSEALSEVRSVDIATIWFPLDRFLQAQHLPGSTNHQRAKVWNKEIRESPPTDKVWLHCERSLARQSLSMNEIESEPAAGPPTRVARLEPSAYHKAVISPSQRSIPTT